MKKSRFKNHKIRNQPGFTLIEIAIMLVILGLLLGLGSKLVGPLLKRAKFTESRQFVKAAKESMLGYAVANGKLPLESGGLAAAGARGTDAWGRNIVYYAADIIENTGNACSQNSTTITIKNCANSDCSTFNTISNIAFLILSSSENANLQTTDASTGTEPVTVTIYEQDTADKDDNNSDGTNPDHYDDIVQYVSLGEIRSQMDCPQDLAITSPTTLTQGEEDSFYTYELKAIGGTPPYTWDAWSSKGLTLNTATGLISGTIDYNTSSTTGNLVSCSESIDVSTTLNDSGGATPQDYTGTLSVRPQPLTILTQTLPDGYEGQSYGGSGGVQLLPYSSIPSGGNSSSYSWSISSGSLPTSTSLSTDGLISGTIDEDGNETSELYNIVAQLTDGCTTTTKAFTITVYDNDTGSSSTSSSSSSSSSTSSSSTGSSSTSSSSSSSGGSAPTCTLSTSPSTVSYNNTSDITWAITNGPADGSFSPTSGTCTTFTSSTGGTCTTDAITNEDINAFTLTVTNDDGNGNCATNIYGGRTEYNVYNDTGSSFDFKIVETGQCKKITDGVEIKAGSTSLNLDQSFERYSTNNNSCGGAVQDTLTYSQAMNKDVASVGGNNDGKVNFTLSGAEDR